MTLLSETGNRLSRISRLSIRLCLLLLVLIAANANAGDRNNTTRPDSAEDFEDATHGGSAFLTAQQQSTDHKDAAGPEQTDNEASNDSVYAILTWEAPTANTDGSRLTDLAGYNVYYRRPSSKKYVHMFHLPLTHKELSCESNKAAGKGKVKTTECTYTVRDLEGGPYYFVVSAYNKAGAESDPSNEVKK